MLRAEAEEDGSGVGDNTKNNDNAKKNENDDVKEKEADENDGDEEGKEGCQEAESEDEAEGLEDRLRQPMEVLPLYSMLPRKAQLRGELLAALMIDQTLESSP